MKLILNDSAKFIVRIDTKENLFLTLLEFCDKNGINSAYFNAIGSASELTLSYYNLADKIYEDKVINENVEILQLTGNLSTLNFKPAMHAHGTFSTSDFQTIGGHIKDLIVSATCEVLIIKLTGVMQRKIDNATGLNLLEAFE